MIGVREEEATEGVAFAFLTFFLSCFFGCSSSSDSSSSFFVSFFHYFSTILPFSRSCLG